MINIYKYNNETWVDIDHGTPEEIHSIMNDYNIHPLVAKELASTTQRPRLEFHGGYIYCILHFPVFKHTHSPGERSQEVDFIIGKNILITARYDTIDALHKFGKTLEVKEILEKKHGYTPNRSIFVNMLHELYGSLFEEFEYIENVTENITSQIFKGKEKDMVISISEITRTLLDFKKITDGHHEILEILHRRGKEIFGEDFSKEMESVIFEYLKINTVIKSNLDMLHDLRDTNDSLLTSKQNETIKKLTIVSFIILPLNLIAFIFSMRAEGMPIISNPNAFWIILGIMLTSALIALVYVRHKKWM
jgi:magnesium transporter